VSNNASGADSTVNVLKIELEHALHSRFFSNLRVNFSGFELVGQLFRIRDAWVKVAAFAGRRLPTHRESRPSPYPSPRRGGERGLVDASTRMIRQRRA
jgi:hypothetical protein